jgi:hypothetical protein
MASLTSAADLPREVSFYPLARIQPYLFAIGMLVFSIAMTFAGSFGVPRRHWDITFSQAPFSVQFSPAVDLVIAVMALGGLLGIVGGAIYISSPCLGVLRPKLARTTAGSARWPRPPPGIVGPRALGGDDERAPARRSARSRGTTRRPGSSWSPSSSTTS